MVAKSTKNTECRRKKYDQYEKAHCRHTDGDHPCNRTHRSRLDGAPGYPGEQSYKGSTLEVGQRSGLIIGPSGTEYTVTSSDPETVAVERVLTSWVAVAKAEGSAEITASNSAGETGAVALTVGPATPDTPEAPAGGNSVSLTDNLEIRQEMIRLINQTRKANGVSELPINEALMNAAQVCSNRRYTWHHAPEEGQAAAEAGYPYGFGDNLTVFTGTADAAQRAVDNWINSAAHS